MLNVKKVNPIKYFSILKALNNEKILADFIEKGVL
jgi:hypothetical protein